MAKHTKAIDLYRTQLARFEAGKVTIVRGHAMLADEGESDLKELLSGKYTRKQTRGAFARRAPAPGSSAPGRRRQLTKRQMANRGLRGTIPDTPINVQSGRLRKGANLKRVGRGTQGFDLQVSGVDYAKYVLAIGGTKKMIARRVRPEIQRRWRPRNKALLDSTKARMGKP